jgi:two-component system, sensor histidine kinase PdtaS
VTALRSTSQQAAQPPERALPIALIANELVSNAVKHGFGAGAQGRIQVELRAVDGSTLALSVADDGIGLPETFELGKGPGLGSQIVLALTATLEGSVTIERGQGTRFVVTFPR